jgi:hypothetical protein
VTAAIFGLIGVIIGGLISGAVQVLLARRSERLQGRSSARVVISELRERRDLLAYWLKLGSWDPSDWTTPERWQWEIRRGDLASALSPRDWEAVEQAHMRIRHVDASNALIRVRQEQGRDATLDDYDQRITRSTIETLTAGINSLRAVAGLRGAEEGPLTIYAGLDR